MISKRDNLLNRPWQERKFENHKRKVQSAIPVVDNKSPPFRGHVAVKLKKSQKETERIKNIEKNNFLLLQRLNYIMKTKWVDNYLSPQPKFLNRVPIYQSDSVSIDIEDEPILSDQNYNEIKAKSRKMMCPACTPQKPPEPKIPEERIPWEPTKKPAGRLRSKSVPAKKSYPLPAINKKPQSASVSTNFSISASRKVTSSTSRTEKSSAQTKKSSETLSPTREKEKITTSISSSSSSLHRPRSKPNLIPAELWIDEPQKIILSRGSLKLAVNFPPDTSVVFKDGQVEKYLARFPCHCQKPSSA